MTRDDANAIATAPGEIPVDPISLFDLSGRTAVVTGAGRGLGRGIAVALAMAGAHVVGVARTEAQLAVTAGIVASARSARNGTLEPLTCDLGDPTALDCLTDAVRARAGLPHIVVHAAGVQVRRPASELTLEEWNRVQAVNLTAPFRLSQAIGAAQRAAGQDGSHVFVASLTSSIGVPGTVAYSASKTGLLGVMRTLAVEWARDGVRVNALGPGYFRTELTEPLLADPERHQWVLSRIPMGRLGTSDDLAGAALFLASDASRYVTGQLLMVDGGWLSA